MVEAQNKIVSIATFRAAKPETKTPADRATGSMRRGPAAGLSQRSIDHRERMLRFLRMEAVARVARKDAREIQGRLLL